MRLCKLLGSLENAPSSNNKHIMTFYLTNTITALNEIKIFVYEADLTFQIKKRHLELEGWGTAPSATHTQINPVFSGTARELHSFSVDLKSFAHMLYLACSPSETLVCVSVLL